MAVSKNLISVNTLRILAGFFVIYLHTTDPFLIFEQYIGGGSWWIIYVLNTLSKVAVPIFVMMSGYLLFNQEKIGDSSKFYYKRLRRVGIPLLLWLVVLFFWKAYWWKASITFEYIAKTITTVDIGPLYFLIVILELYIIAPYLYKLFSRNGKISPITVAVLAIASFAITVVPLLFFQNKFSFSQNILTIAIPYIFYFVAGGFLQKIKVSKKIVPILITTYFITGICAALLAGGDTNSIYVSYFGPSVMAMSFTLFISVLCMENALANALGKSVQKIIQYISGAILGIFLIHPYVLDILGGTTNLSPGHIYSPLWVPILGIVLLVFSICFVLVAIGKKIPLLKSLFG